jgi:membrane protein YdbS with pleckstrin-like domain
MNDALASASAPAPGWADRLSQTQRQVALTFSALFLVFSVGALVGFGRAFLEHPRTDKLAPWIVLAVILLLVAALARSTWLLVRSWRSSAQSPYERRYRRMWLILIALGVPLGFLLAMAVDSGPQAAEIFSNSPITPFAAIACAAGILVVTAVSMLLYHRVVDDHEERALLWANSGAYYALSVALPAAWLLARGGIIPPVGMGTAVLLLLGSFIVQYAIWLWLKYR